MTSLLARYPVDPSRVFLFGFSGQGVQALATLFLHPKLVRGVVAVCPHSAAVPLAFWEELPRTRYLSRDTEAGLEPHR